MGRNWQPGDRAVIDCPHSLNHGRETSILRVGVAGQSLGKTYVGCEVDILCRRSPHHKFCVFENHELRPIYDGNETVSWESCIWQPKKDTVPEPGFMLKEQAE